MEIETLAVIKTSELSEAQMTAIREITYPADHEGDIWFTQEPQVREADPGLADEMVKAGVTSAIIIDDVNAQETEEDLRSTVAP